MLQRGEHVSVNVASGLKRNPGALEQYMKQKSQVFHGVHEHWCTSEHLEMSA